MKKNFWLLLFFLALIADLLFIWMQQDALRWISKPLIVGFLLVFFISYTKGEKSGVKKWLISALVFSIAGDLLLLMEGSNEKFFLFGLASFLVAHLVYILFFHLLRVVEGVKGRVWLVLPVAVYYAFIITILSPELGEMKLPVQVYAVVISFMMMMALHMLFISNKRAGRLMTAGAGMFLLSDSLLAINKFHTSFEGAGIAVMLSYGIAQWLIVAGAANYIKWDDGEGAGTSRT